MTSPELAATIAAAAAAGAGIIYGLVRARTDWTSATVSREAAERDEVRDILAIKDEMIDALKEANAELRRQIEQFVAAEEAWRTEREDYKRRLAAVEDAYRSVMLAVANSGICKLAPGCPNYVPPTSLTS